VTSADILNAKILVVDDKEANVLLLEGMLRVAGYTCVTSTTDPGEVCELYREHRYSLILLDLQMPGIDGFEVMEQLKEIEGDGYLPILVITAQPGHKLRALEAGAKDFVSKPFDFGELRARVHNILEVRLLHLETKRCNRELEETIAELEASREVIRLKTLEEFVIAQQTQESLLPQCLPQVENFHIRASSSPTRYVGGDFYDFLPLSTGEWAGVLADVSGKGVSAALLSSMVLGALNMEFRSGVEPHEIVNSVNRLLCEKSLPFQFLTLFMFTLRPDGAGQFISAGHTPAYLFRAATGKVELLVSDSYIVGMFDFASYRSRPFHLNKGDILVVYSDGLTDTENDRGEMFGEARMREIVSREALSGSKAVETALLKAIEDFTEDVPQTDDITLVVVEKYQ
jgi:serine phosphatase RsbU (regulator of sigma subunit)